MQASILSHHISGDGDPLILVPGGLTGWLSWIPHQERLSGQWQVIRVQPIHNELGSAGHRGDPGYTRETERESLRLTLDHLGIDRAHFAGWSAGGKALLDFTGHYPERVGSLTLVEPGAYWILAQLGETAPELDRLNRHMTSLAGTTVSEDDLAHFLASAGLAENPSEARASPYWERAVPHRMTLSWFSEDLAGSDLAVADLAGISVPVLLTKGTRASPWDRRVVDLLGQHLPDARVLELEGDHAHHIESIDQFLDALVEHLAVATR